MAAERDIAFKALLEYRKAGSWPDLYLKNKLEPLDRAQASLATAITYGVIQNTAKIDYYIANYSSLKLNKISSYVLEAMRMAVYQILFLDRIPDSAAVNESVKLINKTGNRRASGFANGVLRKISREKENLPEIKLSTYEETLSVKYSHPLWLVKKFISVFGKEDAERLLKADNEQDMPVIRVNTLKGSPEEFAEMCREELGETPEAVEGLEGAFSIPELAPLLKSHLFKEGRFYVQDSASQFAVSVLSPEPGDKLLDMCAAPGGKSLLAAQYMENRGKIISNDIYPHKTQLIRENADKYGIEIIETSCKDSSLYSNSFDRDFDKIICDVPCSGLGIIRKKPDIRYKDGKSLSELPPIQLKILENAASCLKKGGRMIYTTCTVLPEENENIVSVFLKTHEDFTLKSFEIRGAKHEGYVTLLPHKDGTDGFFIALLERRK